MGLSKVLCKAQVSRVGLEATGLYHLDLAVALDDAGLDVMVINPKAAKRFAEAMQTRTKTDVVDAALPAQFAQRLSFDPWQRPDAPVPATSRPSTSCLPKPRTNSMPPNSPP